MIVHVSTALPIDQQMNVCEHGTPNRAADECACEHGTHNRAAYECACKHGTHNRAADLIDRLFVYSGIHKQYASHGRYMWQNKLWQYNIDHNK